MRHSYFDLGAATRAFEAARIATLRSRLRTLVVVLSVFWALQLVLGDGKVFAPWACAALRVPEVLANVAIFVALRREQRSLARLERTAVAWTAVVIVSMGVAVFGAKPTFVPIMAGSYLIGLLAFYGVGLRWRALATVFLVASLTFLPVDLVILPQWRLAYAVVVAIFALPYALLTTWSVFRDRDQIAEIDTRLELASTNERLRATEGARSRLFVNLSHDLRTPLAIIRADAEHLRAEARTEDQKRSLERIGRNATTLTELSAQLLELARIDEGRLPKELANVDVTALAREVCAELAPARDVALETCGEEAVARADARHVRRVLANVVGNAVREVARAPGCGTVSVRTRRDGPSGTVVVDVMDDGPGVPPERRAQLFERFAHFDRAGDTVSGIGLALARELAEQSDGSLVYVEDAPRTTFRLTLPAATGPADPFPWDDEPRGSAPNPSSAEVASPASAPVLLVVEDSPDMADVLGRLLSAEYRVHRAARLMEAVEMARSVHPAGIVADVMLPDGTAYDLLERVRADVDLATTPVVLVSALAEPAERARGLTAGADDYVAKPFSSEELLARVRAALARASARERALSDQRHDLALELHDGVAGDLARAVVLLGAERGEANAALAGARAAVRDGLDEVRSLMWTTTHAPEWRELVATVRRGLAESSEAARLALVFRATSDEETARVSPAVAHALRRIVQEAMTNVVRHAGAKSVTCVLSLTGGVATVRVEDDGRGLDGVQAGHGIAGIARRARAQGGYATFSSAASGGAVVEVSLRFAGRAPSSSVAGE